MADRRARKWQWSDLFVDRRTGVLRESLIWSNVGKLAMTWGFVYMTATGKATDWLWLAYGGVICGHELISRGLNIKQQRELPEREYDQSRRDLTDLRGR